MLKPVPYVFLATLLAAEGAFAQQSAPGDTLADSLARFRLAPIEVSVGRSETEISRLPYAISVVNAEGIGPGRARLGLDEALAGVPGVLAANRQNYSLDQTISIRGFGVRSAFGVRGLKVLLDGIPQTLPDGQGQLTNVDLDDVRRVEILRGSASSLHGNAAGGVISLSTEEKRPERVSPTVRVLGGAYGLLKYHGSVDVPVGRGSLALSGVRTQSDGFRVHSQADLRQGRARFTTPFGSNSATVVLQLADSPVIKDPGALTLSEMEADGSQANPLSITRDAGKEVSQSQAGITLARRFAGGGTASVTGFGLKRTLLNPTNAVYIDLRRWAYGARGSVGMPVSVGSRTALVSAGVDAQWQRDNRINENVTRTAVTRDQLERVAEIGPFVQATVDAFPVLTLTVGGRYDRVRFSVDDRFQSDGDDSGERVMSALSGSAGVTLNSSRFAAPYASVSTSFETPTTTELANRPTGPGGFNPVLGPQKTVSFEIGLRGAGGTGDLILDYSVAAYRANLRGELIPFETPGDPGRRFFQNSGSSRHEGIEVGAGIGGGPVSARAGYTYSRNRFLDFRTATTVFDGLEQPGVPKHYLRGVVTVRAGRVGWVAVEQTVSSSYFVNDGNTTTNPGWAATAVRAGLDVTVAGWSISPFGGVSNLFDKRYAGSVQVNAANGRFFEPAARRNGYVGLAVSSKQ